MGAACPPQHSYHPEMCVDSWPIFAAAVCFRGKQVQHTKAKSDNARIPPEWPNDGCL